MANDTETILFEVIFDAQQAEGNAVKLQTRLAELQKEKALLEKAFSKNSIGTAEYGEALRKVNGEITLTSQQLRTQSKAISDNAKVQASAAGSLAQMRAALSAATSEYVQLSKAERDNEATGGMLQQRIRALSDELKAEEAALGDTRRNVGNYHDDTVVLTGSIVALNAKLAGLKKQYDELSEAERNNAEVGGALLSQINDLTDEQERNQQAVANSKRNVSDYVKQLSIAGISVGDVSDAFKQGGQGVQVFTKGIGGARAGLILLGAVPILLFLAGLVAFFKSTDEGADKLAQAVAFLKTGFDELLKGIAPVGKLLVDMFTSPLDTIKKLIAGTDEYKVSLGGIAKQAYAAAQAQKDYTAALQEIEDAEDALVAQRAAVGLQVDLALLQVKDRSKTEKERLTILAAAGKAESDLAKAAVKNAADRLNEEIKLNNQLSQRNGGLSDGEKLKQQEAAAALIEAQRASLSTQQAIQNRTAALIEKETSERKAAEDKRTAAVKKAAEDRIALAEVELIAARRRGQDTLKIEEKVINLTAKAAEIGLAKNSAQRKLIEAKANADILALRVKHAADLMRVEQEGAGLVTSARLALIQKGSDEEQTLLQVQSDQGRLRAKTAAVDAAEADATLRKNLNKQLSAIDAEFNAGDEARDRQYAVSKIERIADLTNKRLDTEKNLQEDTLDNTIAYQAKLIDIEEEHSLALLKLDEVTAEERLVKLNAIQAKALAARKELNKQQAEQERKDGISRANTAVIQATEGSKKELDAKKVLLKKQRDDELANTKLTEAAKAEIRARYRKADEDLDQDYAKRVQDFVFNSLNQSASALSTLSQAQADRDNRKLEQQQAAALKSAGLSAEAKANIEAKFAKKKEELDRKASERARKIATFQNILNTANAITSALATGFDPITKGIGVALAVAAGIAQQVAIASATYARGGITPRTGGPVFGPSHKQGGIQMFGKRGAHIGEMEGDEIILTKGVYRNPVLRARASALNVLGGGIDFAGGRTPLTPMPRMDLGGITAMQSVASGMPPVQPTDYNQIRGMIVDAVAALPPQIVLVKDINTQQGKVTRVEGRAKV